MDNTSSLVNDDREKREKKQKKKRKERNLSDSRTGNSHFLVCHFFSAVVRGSLGYGRLRLSKLDLGTPKISASTSFPVSSTASAMLGRFYDARCISVSARFIALVERSRLFRNFFLSIYRPSYTPERSTDIVCAGVTLAHTTFLTERDRRPCA